MARKTSYGFRAASIARIAVFSALTVLFLFLLRILPSGKIFYLSAASLTLAVIYEEGGRREALYCFITSGLISLFFPGWPFAWPYYLFFGLYPLFKYRIEALAARSRRHVLAIRLGLKTLFALLSATLCLTLLKLFLPAYKDLLLSRMTFETGPASTLLLYYLFFLLFFYVYETCLSLLLHFYKRRIRREL